MTDFFLKKLEETVRPHLPDLWRKVSVLTALALLFQPLVATASGPSPSRPTAYAAAARRLAGLTDMRAARSSSSATIRPPLGGAYGTLAKPESSPLLAPGPVLTATILSTPYATADSNKPATNGPRVWVVEAVISNIGDATATSTRVNLDMNPNASWFLLPGESPRRNLPDIPAGGSQAVYWFAHRSNTVPDPHTYTVTVSAAGVPTVTQSLNFYGNTSGQTIQSRSAIGASNSTIVSSGAEVVVGRAFTMSLDYNMGSGAAGVTVQPTGDVGFTPNAYRLIANEVSFRDVANNPITPTFTNQTYFPPGGLPSGAVFVNATYTFIALKAGNVALCPYTDVFYDPNNKYNEASYCVPGAGTINITGTLTFSLTKSVNAATILQGQALVYTLDFTNTGTLSITNIYVWDNIPTQTITTSVSHPVDTTPGFNTQDRVVWNIGTLEPGASGQRTVTVTVSGRGADLLDGTALVNNGFMGILFDPDTENPAITSTVTTTVQAPTIGISQDDGQTDVIQGQTLTYTLRITNTGSVNAANVVITDVLPSGVTFGSSDPSQGSCSGTSTVVCSFGSLAPSASGVVTVTGSVNFKLADGALLTNTMQARYENTAGYAFAVLSAADVDTVLSPILGISKGGPDSVLSGRNITYTLRITNTGSAASSNVLITDTLPVSTTYSSCSGGASCGQAGGVVSWTVTSLAPAATSVVTFSAQADPSPTGSQIVNSDYGVTSDQTNFVPGAPSIVTTVFNEFATVIGRAFQDDDGDGLLDAGETGLSGITVTLPGAVQPVTVTTSTGNYTFTIEFSGPISVSATLPNNFFRTTPSPVFLDVSLGTTKTVDFGYAPVPIGFGVIYGTVFADSNYNGVRELGEDGISGVSVASASAVTTTVTTNSLGQYALQFSITGTYTVTETNPAFYVSTTPDSVARSVTIDNSSQVDFGDFLGLRIEGQVFDDQNANAANDSEPGLVGVLMEAGGVATNTEASGVYTLYVTVQPGQPITLTETDPAGYVSTAAIPGSGGWTVVNPSALLLSSPVSGTVYSGNDFGDVQLTAGGVVTITGQVFDDANADGLYNDGGSGLAGATLSASSGMVVATAADGLFTLFGPASTIITVTETDPAGYFSTNALPGNDAVRIDQNALRINALAAGLTSAGNYFGDVLPSQAAIVTGTLFNDVDNDGVFDLGESVFSGEQVTISGTVSLITTTNTAGGYQFAVGTGYYIINTSLPAGYHRTTPETLVISATTGNTYPGNNFGFASDSVTTSATVFGTVFDDFNGNGLQDLGEGGLSGATLQLITGTTVVATRTTGAAGAYTFNVTQAGSWKVHEINPPGYFSTSPDELNVPVTLGNSYQVNFGDSNRTDVGSVHGLVFDDLNANGVQDPGEPGIAGVSITTLADNGVDVITATTAAVGQFSYGFDFVSEGFHTIHEDNPPGYRSTTPDDVVVNVLHGFAVVADFGDCQISGPSACPGSVIQGTVFNDANGDGNQDFAELGIPTVTITLYSGVTPISTTTTRSNGDYTFGGLGLGAYRVVETDPTFYHSTTPNEVNVSIDAPDLYTINFGDSNNSGLASIFGTVFNDANANTAFDSNEAGLANVLVTIEGNFTSGGALTTTTTSAGQYTFLIDQITPSDVFTVTETDPAGYLSTTPNTVVQTVALNNDYQVDFGDVQASTVFTVTGFVWDDTASPDGLGCCTPGLGGATVAVNTGMSATTGGSGAYTLYAPGAAGTITVTETNPFGYISTGAIPGTGATTVVNADAIRISGVSGGGASTGNQFGDALVGVIITGTVFNDLNANGVRDSGEGGLAGAVISATNASNVVTTDGSGAFALLTSVTGQPITITETDPAGYVSTAAIAGSGSVSVVNANALRISAPVTGTIYGGNLFGDFNASSVGGAGAVVITGTVFNDLNANGVRNAGEGGVAGAVISATKAVASFTTGVTGVFTLYAPVTGQPITVTETDPAGYVSTAAIAGSGSVSVVNANTLRISNPISGTTYSGNLFGDYNGGAGGTGGVQITGTVYEDRNANLVFDGVDVGAPGVTLSATGGLTTATSVSGTYTLFAPAGTITVTVTVPTGYTATTATSLSFASASGQVSGKDFGLLPPACNPSQNNLDPYEAMGDDNTSTPVTLTIGATQSHNFHRLDDEDWVQVDLRAGSTYTFTVDAAGARADTLLALFAPDGVTQLAQNDDANLPDFSSQIVWVATTTGAHYLRVTQLNPPILGGCETNYTLSLTALLRTLLYLPLIMK